MSPRPGRESGWRLLPAVVFLGPLLACGSSTQLTELEADLGSLERQVDAFRSETPTRGDLAAVLRAVEDLAANDLGANADLKEDLRQIIAEVEALRTAVQEQGRTIAASLERLGRTNDELDLLRGQIERQEDVLASIGEQLEASLQPPPSESVAPETLYGAAYQDYLRGDYELAATGFESYLSTFPDGEDADSAQYWLGESYMGQGRFRTAIEELGRVAERHPDSDKVASSMLRIGVAHIELGERERANEMLLRVREEYPDSDEAILALQQLDNQGDEL